MGLFSRVRDGLVSDAKAVGSFVARHTKAVVTAAVAGVTTLGGSLAHAQTTPTIPDTGVDIAGLVTSYGTKMGLIIGGIVALYFAFLIIRHGMSWGKKAG